MKSWRTTLIGVFMILAAVANAGIAVLDGDPKTEFNWTITLTALAAGWGFIMARDQAAHDEDVK